jgi:protein-S-isoprenylcysteine O-methyltransferase Ste14
VKSRTAPESESSTAKSFWVGPKVILLFFAVAGPALFIAYGSFRWWEAWLLLALWSLYFFLMFTVGRKLNPAVVEERLESLSKFSQRWDRLIIGLYQIDTVGLYVVAGLDRGRFGWTGGISPVLKWTAFGLLVIVYGINFWAIVSNPFASGVVRIQQERDHRVVSNGPYRFVRHPMYLMTVIFAIVFPLFLESYWTLIPGAVAIILFVIRTYLEDTYLKENLPGYIEYARQVRFRLIPGIW